MRFFGFVLIAFVIAGCDSGPKPGSPPIEFSFRESQVPTKGMVAGIRNTSETEALTNLLVQVRGPQEDKPRLHRVNGPVQPLDSITVGWVELDGWKLKSGDSLTVRCDQYEGAETVVVPEQ